MKLLLLLAPAALLASCGTGLIPLGNFNLPDVTITLPAASANNGFVAYSTTNAVADADPRVASITSVTIEANALYTTLLGTATSADMYVRTNFTGCDQSTAASGYVLCPVAGETNNRISTLTLKAGTPQAAVLTGAALNTAVKTRQGYFGLSLTAGSTVMGDQLKLTNVIAKPRL
ncbi:hypothetical protein [Deinococcus maricopensis]|uniref:Lipoprotein n=1 Tax=Deinococcus maricopensis (strain DSM 21211 / LMG 22137 / NRRL B-23946 / LB-34) TaxID=709986 RepID=E8U8H3_DEIML|nr:hypothetical protein [Deinococcus maricopensis]ADV67362.1 conserved hypothetical protein, precursor [Deinococcus maricopensis DSM 21211]